MTDKQPSPWTFSTIGEELNLINGFGFKPHQWKESGTPIVRIQNLNDHKASFDFVQHKVEDRFLVKTGDLLFAWSGSRGTSFGPFIWTRGDAVLNQHIFNVRFRDAALDKTFSYWWLKFLVGEIEQQAHGSAGLVHITRKELEKFRFPVLRHTEQCKIARILTTLDNLIEKTKALIAKYQAIKQGLMHDLFTRGVDEHGHLRPPYAEAPHLYKQSELGWIPGEWDCLALGMVVQRAEYGISVSLNDAEGVPVLRMNNLSHGKIDVADIKRSNHPEARRILLRENDVLFNRTNSIDHVGRTSIWRNELPLASFASYLVRLVPELIKLQPDYLVYWMNRPETQIAIRQFATPGVHQVNINPTNLRKSPIGLPVSMKEQARIVHLIAQQEEAVNMQALYLGKLKQKKTGLMQDLLTGKVRVQPDVEEVEP